MASTSTRSRCGCIPPPRASPSLLPQHPPHSSHSICLPTPGAIFARRPLPSGARVSSGFSPGSTPPIYLTPMTRDRKTATDWLARFEGAGLDGVIAKPEGGIYEPGKRAMIKIKHSRTADCVVAGFRWHKNGTGTRVGSLLLGLYDEKGALQHVGVTSSFTMAAREQLARELAPLRKGALDDHPWREWAKAEPELESHAGRPEPLERRQGPVVGTAAGRASLRSEIRPYAGRSFSPRCRLSALAPRQASGRLHVRSARGHDSLRAREGVRRDGRRSVTPPAPRSGGPHPFGASSGSSGSCGGRSSSGTCSRFTRMRVHVWNRPRMASTSTSDGCRCAAASGCRHRQRSRPSSASSLRCARPISTSGRRGCREPRGFCDPATDRRRDGCTRAGSSGCFR